MGIEILDTRRRLELFTHSTACQHWTCFVSHAHHHPPKSIPCTQVKK